MTYLPLSALEVEAIVRRYKDRSVELRDEEADLLDVFDKSYTTHEAKYSEAGVDCRLKMHGLRNRRQEIQDLLNLLWSRK